MRSVSVIPKGRNMPRAMYKAIDGILRREMGRAQPEIDKAMSDLLIYGACRMSVESVSGDISVKRVEVASQ